MALDNITIQKIVDKMQFIKNAKLEAPFLYQDRVFVLPLYLDNDMFQNPKVIISTQFENPFISFTNDKLGKFPHNEPFLAQLSKLKGSFIESIEKDPVERIVTLHLITNSIEYSTDKLDLIIELLPIHPNIILIEKESKKIVSLYQNIGDLSSPRFLKTGLTYYEVKTDIGPISNQDTNETIKNKITRKLFARIEEERMTVLDLLNKSNLSDLLYFDGKTVFPCCFNNTINIKIEDLYKHLLSNQAVLIKQQKYNDISQAINKYENYYIKKEKNLIKDLEKAKDNLKYKIYGDLLTSVINEQLNPIDGYAMIFETKVPFNQLYNTAKNAQNCYKTYKKAKKGIEVLEQLIEENKQYIRYFEEKKFQYDNSNGKDLEELRNELIYQNYLKSNLSVKRKERLLNQSPHYIKKDNIKIGFGKTGVQNDNLTFNIASKDDLFFHIDKYHGPHVILFDNNSTNGILLAVEAAIYFAKKTDGDVIMTSRNNVKKGGSIGQVTFKKYQTIHIKSIRKNSIELFKTIN